MDQSETNSAPLRGKQSRALDALVNYDTVEGACKAAGVSKSTMYRYLKEPVFDAALKAVVIQNQILSLHVKGLLKFQELSITF